MKNTLSENMMRFGTKNLSESAQKELIVKSIMETINQHGLHGAVKQRLTESVIDLMKTPAAANALKAIQSQYIKGNMSPTAVMGAYYLKVQANQSNALIGRGQVGGLNGKGIGGVGTIPVPADLNNGEGGKLEFGPRDGVWTILTYDTAQVPLPKDAAGVASYLNDSCNAYPLAALQSMLAAHPKKMEFQQAIAAFKSSTSAIKPLLAGNAKAFYGV